MRRPLVAALVLTTSASAQSVLENDHVRFEFDDSAGTLLSIENKVENYAYAIENETPWRILFRCSGGGSGSGYGIGSSALGPNDLGAGLPVVQTSTAGGVQTLRFLWTATYVTDGTEGCAAGSNPITVVTEYELGGGDAYLTAEIRVDASGVDNWGLNFVPLTTTVGIREVRFYLTPDKPAESQDQNYGLISVRGIHGIKEPALNLVPQYLRIDGGGNTEPKAKIDGNCVAWDNATSSKWREDGLTDVFLWQKVLGAYWNQDGEGIYAFPEHDYGFQRLGTAYKSTTGGGFQMAHVELFDDDVRSGVSVASTHPLRIGVFSSSTFRGEETWYAFARLYRSYLEDESSIFEQGTIPNRSDLGTAVKSGGLVWGFFGTDQDPSSYPWTDSTWRDDVRAQHTESATYLGAAEEVLVFNQSFQQYAGSASYTQLLPKAGQDDFFLELRATGLLRPFVYTWMHLLDQQDPEYASYSGSLALNVAGNPITETNAYGNFSWFDSRTTAWQTFTSPKLGRLDSSDPMSGTTPTGSAVGGAYFDASTPGPESYYQQGGSLFGGPGKYQLENPILMIEGVRQALKAADPGYLTVTEDFAEYVVPFQDVVGGDVTPVKAPDVFGADHVDKYLGATTDFYFENFNTAVYHEYAVGVGILAPPLLLTYPQESLVCAGAFVPAVPADVTNVEFFQAKSVIEGGNAPGYNELVEVIFGQVCGPAYAYLPNHRALELPCLEPDVLYLAQAIEDYALMTKRLLAYRKNNPYLISGEWWPPSHILGNTTETRHLLDRNEYIPIVVQAAPRSFWKYGDDQLGVFVANPTDTAKTMTLDFLLSRYEMPSSCNLYSTASNGTRTFIKTVNNAVVHGFTVAPHSVRQFELVPVSGPVQ